MGGRPAAPPPTTMPSDHARPGYDPDQEVHRDYDPDRPFVWDMRPEVPLRMPDEFALEDEADEIAHGRMLDERYPDRDFDYDTSGMDGGDALLDALGRTGSRNFLAAMGQYEYALAIAADMDPERRKQLVKRREHEYRVIRTNACVKSLATGEVIEVLDTRNQTGYIAAREAARRDGAPLRIRWHHGKGVNQARVDAGEPILDWYDWRGKRYEFFTDHM